MQRPIKPTEPLPPQKVRGIVLQAYVDYEFSSDEFKSGMVDIAVEKLNQKLVNKGFHPTVTASGITIDSYTTDYYTGAHIIIAEYTRKLTDEEWKKHNAKYKEDLAAYDEKYKLYETQFVIFEKELEQYGKDMRAYEDWR